MYPAARPGGLKRHAGSRTAGSALAAAEGMLHYGGR